MANFIKWWYTGGWKSFLGSIKDRLSSSLDYFSMGSLLRTLFSPFRQIDAGGSGVQALFSRLFSRIIGAVVRLFVLLFGTIVLIIESIISLVLLLLWPLVPLAPFAGVILTIMQVTI